MNSNANNKIRPPVASKATNAAKASTPVHATEKKEKKDMPKEGDPLYKTVICKNFEKNGKCKYGKRCTFAHGKDELREKPKRRPRRNQRKTETPQQRPQPTERTLAAFIPAQFSLNDADFPALPVPEQRETAKPLRDLTPTVTQEGTESDDDTDHTELVEVSPDLTRNTLKRCNAMGPDELAVATEAVRAAEGEETDDDLPELVESDDCQCAECTAPIAPVYRVLHFNAPSFTPTNLNVYAPEFVPAVAAVLDATAAPFVPASRPLRADAPEFVPGALNAYAPEFVPGMPYF